ncbi:MAG: pyridoxal-phosphate dependent enzyme [Sporichthyaceae bacterium]|nr:pyridoxal-phosphate dependent enzyme [Sporichthyaceae bacterium]
MTEPAPIWASRCLRCGHTTALDDRVTGCERCAAEGFGVPMMPSRSGPVPAKPRPAPAGSGPMWRWSSLLVPSGQPVSLGEGGTPLVELRLPGVPGRILLKDEAANPTGSFKDRLASGAVSRARHLEAGTVALASSGNAGISAAAYAAAAGLPCVVISTPGLPEPTGAALRALGATLLLTDQSAQRWTALRTGVERLGWHPLTNYLDPPVASHPAGVHAYRTIAYEIAESLDWRVPDWVVVPVSRGDGLYGVWAGFVELAELGWTDAVPRMLAVERFPSLSAALADGLAQPARVDYDGQVQARSIGDRKATMMSLLTVQRSGGSAVSCDDAQLWAAWRQLAATGTLVELASAAGLCGAVELAARGELTDRSTVVLLSTAAPYAQATLGPAGEASRCPIRQILTCCSPSSRPEPRRRRARDRTV